MAHRITLAMDREVLRLHKRKMTYRQIAKRVGIAHSSVAKICRRGKPTPPKKRRPDEYGRISLGVGKCPICHHEVDLPCIACSIQRRPLPAAVDDYEPITYELTPDAENRRLGVIFHHHYVEMREDVDNPGK